MVAKSCIQAFLLKQLTFSKPNVITFNQKVVTLAVNKLTKETVAAICQRINSESSDIHDCILEVFLQLVQQQVTEPPLLLKSHQAQFLYLCLIDSVSHLPLPWPNLVSVC